MNLYHLIMDLLYPFFYAHHKDIHDRLDKIEELIKTKYPHTD